MSYPATAQAISSTRSRAGIAGCPGWGDICHRPIVLAAPRLGFVFDHDPAMAAESRRRLFASLAGEDVETRLPLSVPGARTAQRLNAGGLRLDRRPTLTDRVPRPALRSWPSRGLRSSVHGEGAAPCCLGSPAFDKRGGIAAKDRAKDRGAATEAVADVRARQAGKASAG